MGTMKYILYRNDDAVSVTVEYDYTPFSKGERESRTELPLSPNDQEDAEVTSILNEQGEEETITPWEKECIEIACIQNENTEREDALLQRQLVFMEEREDLQRYDY